MSVVEFGIEKGYVEREEDEFYEHFIIHPRRVLNSFVLDRIKLEFEENGFYVQYGKDRLFHCLKPLKVFDYKKNYEILVDMVEALGSDKIFSEKAIVKKAVNFNDLFDKIIELRKTVRTMEEERNVT